jgi:hypothetical protein
MTPTDAAEFIFPAQQAGYTMEIWQTLVTTSPLTRFA